MVTLLMTFFVLMFAISNVDSAKASLLFAALSRDGLSPEVYMQIVDEHGPIWDPSDDPFADLIPPPTGEDNLDPSGPTAAESAELIALAELITDLIADKGLGDQMSLQFDGEFLLLTLANNIQFDSARVEITPEMREIASDIAHLLAAVYNPEKPFEIVVAGHTDNVPINTVQFPSNWHVSHARSTNFLEILLTESRLDPAYFYSRSCGEFRPIADNSTAEGRQANRRVEVAISLAREDNRWGINHILHGAQADG
jgi:chemotaxis protein MotB